MQAMSPDVADIHYDVLPGYWWALAGNLILQAFVLSTVAMRTDWSYQVEKVGKQYSLM